MTNNHIGFYSKRKIRMNGWMNGQMILENIPKERWPNLFTKNKRKKKEKKVSQ